MAELDKIGKAIIATMAALRGGIKKNSTVGTGSYAYKGVSDMDVKNAIGTAMSENGLSMIPIEITPILKVESWTAGDKIKNQIFCEVKTKYLLIHGESGQNITVEGYGHGIDSADKAAGKATTYALKYALLYTFMVPTGDIDDTDSTHSEEQPQKPVNKPQSRPPQANTPAPAQKPQQAAPNQPTKKETPPPIPGELKWLHEDPEMLTTAITRISAKKTTIEKIEKAYKLNEVTRKVLISYENNTNI
jgi:hypothetical protein